MTGLLVSVRNAQEAIVASRAGADLIDVKEPNQGSLGAASPHVWREVRDVIGEQLSLSVALGELRQDSVEENSKQTFGCSFAKVGLAGCGDVASWWTLWEQSIRQLPMGVDPVAVVYADQHAAKSPDPAQIIDFAYKFGCAAVLFDTFSKVAGNLFTHLDDSQLAEHGSHVHELGMKLVLGGSINLTTLPRALALLPDYVAVRGAVCRDSRVGRIDGDLVSELACRIHQGTGVTRRAAEIFRRA